MGLLSSFQNIPYTQSLRNSPLSSSLLALLIICIITRIVTGLRSNVAQNNHDAATKTPNTIPYWLPFIGTALSFLKNIESTITHDRYASGDGIFAYRMGPGKAYVISMPSLVMQVFAQRSNVLNKVKTLEWFMNAAFDDKFAFRNEHDAVHGHHNALNLMLKSEFTTEATNKTARAVERKASQLITKAPWMFPDEQGKAMEPWEEAGNVRFNTDGTFEANLFSLVINYMGQIVIDMLWGKALLENFPTIQKDMWSFDRDIHTMLRPVIGKHLPSGRRGIAARERLGVAMKEWYDAVAAKQAGRDPGAKWGALDDISQVMHDRVKVWVDTNASERLQKTNDISVLWGVNVNSNKNVFWMLMQINSRPEVLSDIREEIAPYVHISPTGERGPTGFPKLSIDVDGLMKHCPLLKASFYETMRMNMAGLGVREIIKDVVLKESAEDAALFGKKRPQSYTIPAGSTLVIANGPMQMDQRIFANPEEFHPERFFEDGPDGTTRVTMKNLHTFGGGMYKCKGRYFAEKEVMIFASSLLVMWDISPIEGEVLEVPGMGNVGGSRRPIEDVRVKLTRRYN
ncbi:hypothetical protein HBH98_160140 [Parastagonospora nodorum]|nr:hypothetical protein HBH52_118310 [Parastagonospora nodorum]KAH3984537.1 hypothetical protein HBH51_030330 [Parastagonospora nodorum]KAH4000509.1 hypothetical protein HBI10_103090 [Parastagonospora nodorum]KAH4026463.1 hypothetical protein HBI13_062520 [Parastagonospora nodorum]KAH4068070.1 hypothetical protein HBH50_122140 [Parastagonospora nodorum]